MGFIEGAGGFGGEDEGGAVGQGAGDGDALLLADGELGGAIVQAILQADAFQQVGGPGFVGFAAGEAHAQQHVLQRGEAAQKVVRLEDVADVAAAELVALGLGEEGDIGGGAAGEGIGDGAGGLGRGCRRANEGAWFCRSRRSR